MLGEITWDWKKSVMLNNREQNIKTWQTKDLQYLMVTVLVINMIGSVTICLDSNAHGFVYGEIKVVTRRPCVYIYRIFRARISNCGPRGITISEQSSSPYFIAENPWVKMSSQIWSGIKNCTYMHNQLNKKGGGVRWSGKWLILQTSYILLRTENSYRTYLLRIWIETTPFIDGRGKEAIR